MDGRIRFVYATCGRRYFCIRIKKFADTKISGYLWMGPQAGNSSVRPADSSTRDDFAPDQ